MNKKKLEQIIMFLLMPAFLISLFFYMNSQKKLKTAPAATAQAPKAMDSAELKKLEPGELSAGAKYEGAEIDPLKDKFKLWLDIVNVPQQTTSAVSTPLGPIRIQGLIWNSLKPQAIINDRVVQKGDTIESDAKIIEITKEGITISHEDKIEFNKK